MNISVFSSVWWVAAGQRAGRTALAALLPLAALLIANRVSPLYVLSIVALATVLSVLTSFAGLPELGGDIKSLWGSLLIRTLRTAAQTAIPAIGSGILFEQVDWYTVGVTVGGASLTSLVRGLMNYLPETLPTVPGQVVVTPDLGTKVIVDNPAGTVEMLHENAELERGREPESLA